MSKKKKSLKFTFAAKTQQKIVRKTKQKKNSVIRGWPTTQTHL